MTTPTDTPRTHEEMWTTDYHHELCNVVNTEFAQQLERELSHSLANQLKTQAEIEHIKGLLKDISAVHINTLRGNIATLSWDSYEHIIGPHPIRKRAEKAEAEVKEIRSALGDDGRRTHKEILELATKASQWREWKEKYIDLKNAHIAEGQDPAGTIWEHADKLQRELNASKAEVEGLKELVNESIVEKSNLSIALVNCQANLRRAIDVARMLPVIPIPAISSRDITDTLYAELNQLKATLNPTDK